MSALILVITAIILYMLWKLRQSSNFDGYINLVHLKLTRKQMHEALLLWSKRHENVFPLRLGNFDLVVINGHKLIKEALGDSRLDERPDFTPFQLLSSRRNKGIFNGRGDSWKTTRHLTLHHLKQYGMGKKTLDVDIHSAISNILTAIPKDKSVCLEAYLSEGVTAFMGKLLVGQDIGPTVPKLMLNLAREANALGALGFVPSLTKNPLLSRIFGSSRIESLKEELYFLISKFIQRHDSTEETHPEGILTVLLKDLKKAQVAEGSVAIISDIFFGGSVKLASTLQWAILYLAAHPVAQRELQVEIDEIIGDDCIPSISARPQMPYTIAVLMETLRKSSFFPLGAFHRATSSVEFNGVSMKEGTVICTNLWSSHHDPDVWDNPDQFKPERFIKYEEGRKKLIRHEASLPFSAGGRGCLGELLAKEFLFLSLVSVFQRFDIRLANSADRDLLFESTCQWLGLPPRVAVVLRNRNK